MTLGDFGLLSQFLSIKLSAQKVEKRNVKRVCLNKYRYHLNEITHISSDLIKSLAGDLHNTFFASFYPKLLHNRIPLEIKGSGLLVCWFGSGWLWWEYNICYTYYLPHPYIAIPSSSSCPHAHAGAQLLPLARALCVCDSDSSISTRQFHCFQVATSKLLWKPTRFHLAVIL